MSGSLLDRFESGGMLAARLLLGPAPSFDLSFELPPLNAPSLDLNKNVRIIKLKLKLLHPLCNVLIVLFVVLYNTLNIFVTYTYDESSSPGLSSRELLAGDPIGSPDENHAGGSGPSGSIDPDFLFDNRRSCRASAARS